MTLSLKTDAVCDVCEKIRVAQVVVQEPLFRDEKATRTTLHVCACTVRIESVEAVSPHTGRD